MGAGFRDPALTLAQRVDDLLSRLTLAEKVGLLHQYQAPIPRLDIGEFRTGTEALHGLAWLGPATVFPQAIGLASTWNRALIRRVGEAVGDETRGFHQKDPTRGGLNVWAPVVNPLRDPRWGRNEEGYAEDPFLTGALATAYAAGLRGDHPTYLKTAPTLKHFLGYNNETRRDTTSSNLPPRVLHEYELPAFRAPIAAGAAVAVMASYNLVNGRPTHLSPLINGVLRGWSDDDVLVVSDAQAPSNLATVQHYHPDHASSHAAMVKAGVDSFTDNDDRAELTAARVTEALDRGLLAESDVDASVRHLLAVRFRLGEFDDPAGNPYATITEEVINCPAHQALAGVAAAQAMVLLKNDGLLPLTAAAAATVAVVGPLADAVYEDWYSGTLPYAHTARAALAERRGAANVRYAEGTDRIALRVAAGVAGFAGRYLVLSDGLHGAVVRADGDCAGPATWIDLGDWGQGVVTGRACANGRYLTVDAAHALVNEAIAPGGWSVRETFELENLTTDVVVRHVATARYLVVAADGAVRASGTTAAEATRFEVEMIRDGVAEAVAAASAADVAVVFVGNHPLINGRETQDRSDLSLPPAQERLIRAVLATNPRTVLVVTSSYPYAIGWAQQHVPAMLWSAHGGQESGRALADVLYGDTAPAGRLTQTWYSSAAELPDLLEYDIIATDATYLYYRGAPLYPFGHGLTYSPVTYSDLRLSHSHIGADGEVRVTVRVENTGERATDEVVQLYTRQRHSRVKQPLRQLRGFERVHVVAGGYVNVHFVIKASDLAFWDVTRGRFVVERATHTIMVGRSSADVRADAELTVAGEVIPPRAADHLAGIDADDYGGTILVDADPVAGDAVGSAEPGAWLCFAGTDLGEMSTCVVEMSRLGDGPAALTLRLDDPLGGPLLGRAEVDCTGGRHVWHTGDLRYGGDIGLAAIDGGRVRDLFAVFDVAGVNLRALRFRGPGRPDLDRAGAT